MLRSVISSTELPPGYTYYGIFTFDSIYIPGDERSKTNPGHGYPEHYECSSKLLVTMDRAEWEKEIAAWTRRSVDFVPMKIDVPRLKTETKVDITW